MINLVPVGKPYSTGLKLTDMEEFSFKNKILILHTFFWEQQLRNEEKTKHFSYPTFLDIFILRSEVKKNLIKIYAYEPVFYIVNAYMKNYPDNTISRL